MITATGPIPTHSQSQAGPKPAERGILRRFAHLVSAQMVEGVANAGFTLYIAWLSSSLYGEVMYALAGGAIVLEVVQFGLYYPLVAILGREDDDAKPEILNRVNIIKIAFLVLAISFLPGFAIYEHFSTEMTLILIFVSSGLGLDAFAETFFADMRVRGRQDQEARIRIAGSLLGYGFGFAAVAAGLHPILISLFALVSGVVKFGIAIVVVYKRTYSASLFMRPEWPAVWFMFRASVTFALIEILGVLYNKTNIFFLESAAGVKSVAYYSAAWSVVNTCSTIVSQQFLGWVIFPLLASIWWTNRDRAARLIHSNAKWLMIVALPIMFFLHVESELLIGLIFPEEYADAIWMQKFLVWCILFSFEHNLFLYVMMVTGGAKALLLFSIMVTLVNLALNLTLVEPLGLLGACLVIILTKLIMALLSFLYCQIRFRFFGPSDALFPLGLAAVSLVIFVICKPVIGLHPAVAVTVLFYFVMIWRLGERFLGPLPTRGPDSEPSSPQAA